MMAFSIRQSLVFLSLLMVSIVFARADARILVFPGAGYGELAYRRIRTALEKGLSLNRVTFCLGHGLAGVHALSHELGQNTSLCTGGIILYGAGTSLVEPYPAQLFGSQHQSRVLSLRGTRDGVAPWGPFVASWYREQRSKVTEFESVLLPGAAHHSIVDSTVPLSTIVRELDLRAERSESEVVTEIVQLAREFFGQHGESSLLANARLQTLKMAQPLIDALHLEGTTQLGTPACNSDYPTNPTCLYPAYPSHSLPPGPKPAPSPPLPSNCVCGSPWVMEMGTSSLADFGASSLPSASTVSKDAYHDPSDVHPFHLAHIFNTCNGSSPCTLNTTTVTLPVLKSGDLFPANSTLSAFELKTKLKSRVALWEAAGLGKQPGSLDKNMSICRGINQKAYDWALNHAEASVRAKFMKDGEPFVMVDDKEAPIGLEGPTWIEKEMVYTRVKEQGSSHITVQSWAFVVANTNEGHLPWFAPVGMHYCKLLSPARAMEWIYLEGLRASLSLKSTLE